MTLKTIAIISAFGAFTAAHADLLSLYDFNLASTSGTTAANAALLMTASGGSMEAGSTLSTTTAIANVVSFTGSVDNMVATDTAGAALALQGGANNVNNGTSLTMTGTAGAGKSMGALDLSFAGQATSTGFNSIQLAYSKNGGAYTNFGSAFHLASSSTTPSFTSGTVNSAFDENFDLTSLGTGITSIGLRLTYTGATSSSGNIRLDNIQLNGRPAVVPEPMPIAVLGLGIVGLIARRRK